jgi:drug/metabolite transporter (DMT)-like permease
LLAWPVLGERPDVMRVAGLAIGLGGIATLLLGQLLQLPAAALVAKLPGVALILGTAVMFATGAVVTKRAPVGLPPAANVAWQIAIGSAPMMIVAVLFDRWDMSAIDAPGWAALGYVTVIALCLSYVTWFGALRVLPAGTATIGTLLVPVIGVVSSAALLGEGIGLRHLLALAMTIAGVVLASRSRAGR